MIWNQAQGNWTRFKGRAKEKWGRSAEDGIGQAPGERDILIGQIQNKYRAAREEAETRMKDWKKILG